MDCALYWIGLPEHTSIATQGYLGVSKDVLFQRALETGKDATAIVKEKQRLRDVTKLVDVATTLEALKEMTL